MEELSLTTLERDNDSATSCTAMSERLEFGKFCISPDGPIESNSDKIPIGYSQLGWSNTFPQELISSCHPTSLGISKEGSDVLPEETKHGTVLRPVVRNGNRIRSVFYRVRSRSEDGEGKGGRRYTLARYLVVPTEDTSPLVMFEAMDRVLLGGMTRNEARKIFPLALTEQELKPDSVGEAFLREAQIYVLSGVPISITDKISEEEFFTLVALLHDRVPKVLRPHISAGWNVGSSYSGNLGVTYTSHRAANAALFSPNTLAWSPPECMTTWNKPGEAVVSSYDQSRLEPGLLFHEYISLPTENERQDRPLEADERLSILVDSLPPIKKLPELPDWHDPPTVRLLRYPGLQARDQFALEALEQWLNDNEDNPRLVRDVRQLSYRANRMTALNLILAALAEPTLRERADDALWRSVTGKAPDLFTTRIKGANGDGADRARLLAAIGSGDVKETIEAFQRAGGDEREDLPDEAVANLERILDASISDANRNFLQYHIKLLGAASSHYRDWVKPRALELMLALKLQDGAPDAAYETIVTISDSNEARALHELIKEVKPTETSTSLVGSLRQAARRIFLELFNHRWILKDKRTAARREDLLRWFHVLKPEEPAHSLLRMHVGKQLQDSEVSAIGDEVEQRQVPSSLLPEIAVLALERWSVLGRRILSQPRTWCEVTRLWPMDHARILGRNQGQESPSPAVINAATNLRLSFSDIATILTRKITKDEFLRNAPLLWNWAVRLPKSVGDHLTALDLCVYISAGQLPPGKAITDDELQRFADLAQASGGLRLSSEVLQRMWIESTERWQTELLLHLSPMEDFQPSAYQLGLWVPKQAWLIGHLARSPLHGLRRNRFYVATQAFQSLSYLDDQMHWQYGFITTGIWAAFRRVPVAILPRFALRRALRGYTDSDWEMPTAQQSLDLIERQARMCLTFVQGYTGRDGQSSASRDGALKFVLLDFLLSALRRKDYEAAFDVFLDVEARLPGSRSKRTPKYSFSPAILALLEEIFMLSDRKLLENVIHAYYKESR